MLIERKVILAFRAIFASVSRDASAVVVINQIITTPTILARAMSTIVDIYENRHKIMSKKINR